MNFLPDSPPRAFFSHNIEAETKLKDNDQLDIKINEIQKNINESETFLEEKHM